MALRCHLWQMGHTQYLAVAAQGAQELAHHFRGTTSDADIDLVEHQGGGGGGLGDHHLDGQADARQFAAGGHLGQGSGRLTGVGADQKLDVLHAVWGRLVIAVPVKMGDKLHRRHAQLGQFLGDTLIQLHRSLLACVGKFAGKRVKAGALIFQVGFQLFQAAFATLQFGQFAAQAGL